jgi:hypothetical protein
MILGPDDPRAITNRGWRSPIPAIAKELAATVEKWGPATNDYNPQCPRCVAWSIYWKTFRCPTAEEVKNT